MPKCLSVLRNGGLRNCDETQKFLKAAMEDLLIKNISSQDGIVLNQITNTMIRVEVNRRKFGSQGNDGVLSLPVK